MAGPQVQGNDGWGLVSNEMAVIDELTRDDKKLS